MLTCFYSFLSCVFPFNAHQNSQIIKLNYLFTELHPQGRNVNDITEGFHPLKPLVWVMFGFVRVRIMEFGLVIKLHCFPEDEKSGEQKAREEHLLRELFELIDERDKLERKKMTNMKK